MHTPHPIPPLLGLSIQGSSDDGVWVALARAEVRAWERDPAVGHDHLRMACDAHRRSIDLLETGFAEVYGAIGGSLHSAIAWKGVRRGSFLGIYPTNLITSSSEIHYMMQQRMGAAACCIPVLL